MASFLLAIKRNNNDYVPIDWTLSSLFKNINLSQPPSININSLESIDTFTKNYTSEYLTDQFFSDNLIDIDLKDKPLVIIFKSKDKYQELEQGVIFEEDKEALDSDFIYTTIMDNLNNKEMLNWIYTHYKGKNKDKKYSARLESLLECIRTFKAISIMNQLASINELTYIERRSLSLLLKRKILPRINKNIIEESVSLKRSSSKYEKKQ